MAPIDPDQLLKALDSLLSKNGGIKSVEDVPRLASIRNGQLKPLQCVWSCVLVVFIAITINIMISLQQLREESRFFNSIYYAV